MAFGRGISVWVSALPLSLLSHACESSSVPILVPKLAAQLLIMVEIHKIPVIVLGGKRIPQGVG